MNFQLFGSFFILKNKISKHLNNIFETGELDGNRTIFK